MDFIVEIQNNLNSLIKEKRNLTDKDFRWKMAYIAELAELLDSIGYKWWTTQEQDIQNIKIELVDLLHFMISEIQNLYLPAETPKLKDPYLIIENMTRHYFENNHKEAMLYYWTLVNLYSTPEEIIKIYLIKNVLNELRQIRKSRIFKFKDADLRIEDNDLIFIILPYLPELTEYNYKSEILKELKKVVEL